MNNQKRIVLFLMFKVNKSCDVKENEKRDSIFLRDSIIYSRDSWSRGSFIKIINNLVKM